MAARSTDGTAVPAVVVTELAVQAAHTALANGWFPGGVLFVDLFGYDPDPARRIDSGQALEGFLRALGVPGDLIAPGLQDRVRLLSFGAGRLCA